MQRIAFSLLLCLIWQLTSAQDPWPKGKGHGYAQILFNTLPAYNNLYVGDGEIATLDREYRDITVATFGEVGLTKRFSIGATVPFVMVASGAASSASQPPLLPEDQLTTLGNVSVFGKYTLVDKKFKLAVIGNVDAPTSSRDAASGLATGVDAFTLQPKVSVGRGFGKLYAYSYFGYGYRTNDHHDIINAGIEGGYRFTEKLWLMLHITHWNHLNNGNNNVDEPAQRITGLYTSYQEYDAFLLKLFGENLYKGYGGFVSLGGGSGTSVAASPAMSLGVFRKW